MGTGQLAENSEVTSESVGIQGLAHFVLQVRDLERSRAFYRDVLGWRETPPTSRNDHTGKPQAVFSAGHTHHEMLLVEVGESAADLPEDPRVGMEHFALLVGDTDDHLRAMKERLLSHGVVPWAEKDHGVTRSLYVHDPDGNEVEVFVDVPGADWGYDNVARRSTPLDI